MKKLNTIFLLSLSYSPIFAADDIASLYSLSENVRNIVVKTDEFKEARSPELRKTQNGVDQIVALSSLDKEIEIYANSEDVNCEENKKLEKEKLQREIENRDFVIYFSGMYSDNAEERSLSEFRVENYRSFMLGQYNEAKITSNYLFDFKNLEKEASKNSDYSKLSLDEKVKRLKEFSLTKYKIDVPTDLLTEEALRLELIRNPNDWKKNLSLVKENLDFDQKMRVAARMGSVFLNNYNYDRANSSGGTKVSVEEMLEAARTNSPGGICRDVAYAQGQFLKELGVKENNIFIIGYDSSAGGHAVLAVQDPNNKDRIVKLNYGEMTKEDQLKGSSALKQDTQLPDVGMNFRVYNVDSKPIANIPTEIGQILKDVTNAKSPMISTKPYILNRLGAQTPYGNASIFTGTTSSGDKVVGASIDKTFLAGDSGALTLAGAYVTREVDSPVVEINQKVMFARMRAELYSPEFNVGKVVTRAEIGTDLEIFSSQQTGATGKNKEYAFDSKTLATNVGVDVALKSEYRYSPKSKISLESRAYGYVDWEDERASAKKTIAFDRVETGVTYEADLDEVEVMAKAGIVSRRIGHSYFVGSGLKVKSTDTSVYGTYTSPSGEVPSFMPESSKRVIVGGEQSLGDMKFTLEYKRDLDVNENIYFLNANYKF